MRLQRHYRPNRRDPSADLKGRLRRQGMKRLGVAAVEFAIIANVFFIMLLACMEFARLNMVRNLSQDAAYYAARQAIVPGATSDEAHAEADRIMSALLNHGYTVDVSEVNKEAMDVSVTVSVDLHKVALFTPLFLPDTTMRTTARIRTERYDGFFAQ